jgi:hypothetical protein
MELQDHIVKINDEIGILVEHSFTQRTYLNVPKAM